MFASTRRTLARISSEEAVHTNGLAFVFQLLLSIDEKTQIQALDRTQPMLPIAFGAREKRTSDYVRNGTTNLFAALNVGSGEVFGECKPTRNGTDFLDFLKKAVKPHADKEIHVVLDNLSAHTTSNVEKWLSQKMLTSNFTSRQSVRRGSTGSRPGSGLITRQSIRHETYRASRF